MPPAECRDSERNISAYADPNLAQVRQGVLEVEHYKEEECEYENREDNSRN